ncbi:MAG: SDR family NAD(P)-dependent oxidoreductase [Planctomycetota bacterium]
MSAPVARHEVAIVGAGFSGMAAAIALRRAGIGDFVVLEKAATFGGTWRENTYPGCACDVPAHLYSFSFAPNAGWSRVFAGQEELQRYLQRVAGDFGLARDTRFGIELRRASWDEPRRQWRLETTQGVVEARHLVLGTGPLHHPSLPTLPGLESFRGEAFHTARWRHDLDLRGKRVAVVGTGSSSIQLVPELQPLVSHLTVFQRTAPWVLPKPDHGYPGPQRLAFRRLPGARLAYRGAIYGALELLQLAQRDPDAMRQVQRLGLWLLRRQVPDPALRAQLTPDFVLGCKRLLLSNTYYPALQAENARLVARGVVRVTPKGLVDDAGEEHPVDAIVWATGFRVTDPPIAEQVLGADGLSLAESWGGSPRAYLGTTVRGFPNLFHIIGPNLGNGHGSALTIIEAQARYLTEALLALRREGADRLEVRRGLEATWNDEVQAALAGTVWNAGGCASYYLDRNGRNSSIYPWSTIDLRRRLARFDPDDYRLVRAGEPGPRRVGAPRPVRLRGAVVAITGAARGIGLATARAFLAAGARVVLGDLDGAAAEAAARELGPAALGLRLDVTRRTSFAAFLERAEALSGPLDVLVNNAGVMPAGPFLEEPDEVGAATLAVNYRGVELGLKLALPGMLARGEGQVVNVISLAGKLAVPGLASYVASKHAAVGLSAAVRRELEGSGVVVSAVLPTAVRTRLSQGISLGGLFTQEPEDVAAAVLEVCRTGAGERAVPRFLGVAGPVLGLLPERLDRGLRRLVRGDRAARAGQAPGRRDYEAEIEEQGRALGATASGA